jgi:hypothetical protein
VADQEDAQMSRTHTITTAAVGLALAVPGAAAAQDDHRSPDARYGWPEPARMSADRVSPDARYGVPDGSTPAPVVTIPRTRVVEIDQTGFEWGDAAIGGAAAVAVFLTAGGLVLTLRPRRRPVTH